MGKAIGEILAVIKGGFSPGELYLKTREIKTKFFREMNE